MTKSRIRPYRTVRDQNQPAVTWARILGDDSVPLAADDWDPATDLTIRAFVDVDVTAILGDCGLSPADDLRLFFGWASSGTRVKGGRLGEQRVSAVSGPQTIDVVVPGAQVSGRLDLDVSLVLATDAPHRDFVAHRSGSVLWRSQAKVNLSGTGTRFPTEVADFSLIPGVEPNAAWFLEWDPKEPAMPLLGGIRLMINSNAPRVVSAVTTGSGSPDASAIRDAIKHDVARSMLTAALTLWTEEDVRDLEPGTVGDAVMRLVGAINRGSSLTSAQATFASRPSEIEASLLGYLRTFGRDPEVGFAPVA